MEMGIFVAISMLACSVHAQVQDSDVEELAGRSSRFATALYRKMASTSDDNVVVSPLAATLGLASLAEGADANTRTELLQGLGLAPMERDGEPNRIPTLLQKLKETSAQTLATPLFISRQFQAESGFSTQVKQFYSTDVQSVDFTSTQTAKGQIDDYLISSTGNKIKDVASDLDPQSQLMLISAAYFTGQWKLPFNSSFTLEERFYINKYKTIQVPMMIRAGKFYLAYDPALKVGILKLACMDGTAMLLLLPDEDVDYTSIDESLTGEVFLGWVAKLKKTKLEVQMPRFSLDQTFSLKQSLPSLGMSKILESSTDFSGISKSPGLKLSEVLQKVSVEVDEGRGSDASSSSSFMDSLPPRLTFNRPFIFLVYHEATRSLLHMGRVVDPTKK